ncbi:nucleotide exchange factor GrpE, partial [Candidatus Saccharibacteria bacterium]|nr:nucleotide exchange factor GrpE [Candidatus Saccharibacteria bacterium]
EGDEEVVSEELQSGYVLGEQVIRHAMVKVTRG